MTDDAETGERFCPECGYNLRGLGEGRCPECGFEVRGMVAGVPWEHRGEMGRVRAFWRTVVMVSFRPGRVGRAVGGPLDLTGAVRFRTVVAVLFAAAVLWVYAVAVGFYRDGMPEAWGFDVTEGVSREVLGPGLGAQWEARLMWSAGATKTGVILVGAIFAACIVCWSPLFTVGSLSLAGVRRERMKALGAYACAPLAWTPVCAALFHAYRVFGQSEVRQIAKEGWMVFTLVTWGSIALTGATAWFSPARMFAKATHGGVGKSVLAGVAGLAGGLVMGVVLGLGVFPCLVGLVWIALHSLRMP